MLIFDPILGPVLRISPDAALLAASLGSALILILVRKWTTDQARLRQVKLDKAVLRRRIGQARREGDRSGLKRLKTVRSMVAMVALKAEGKPLAIAIVPVIFLATWCFLRLEFHPPEVNQPVTVAAYVPVSAAGEVMHLMPDPARQTDGLISLITAVTDQGPPYGKAVWTTRAVEAGDRGELIFVYQTHRLSHPWSAGGLDAPPTVVEHPDGIVTEIQLRPFQPFGIIPGFPSLMLSPWIIAYILIVVPAVFLLKPLLKIY